MTLNKRNETLEILAGLSKERPCSRIGQLACNVADNTEHAVDAIDDESFHREADRLWRHFAQHREEYPEYVIRQPNDDEGVMLDRTPVFASLSKLVALHPDWRIGELVCKAADMAGVNVWDVEDVQLLAAVNKHLEEHGRLPPAVRAAVGPAA